jgi:hypothetical protein
MAKIIQCFTTFGSFIAVESNPLTTGMEPRLEKYLDHAAKRTWDATRRTRS